MHCTSAHVAHCYTNATWKSASHLRSLRSSSMYLQSNVRNSSIHSIAIEYLRNVVVVCTAFTFTSLMLIHAPRKCETPGISASSRKRRIRFTTRRATLQCAIPRAIRRPQTHPSRTPKESHGIVSGSVMIGQHRTQQAGFKCCREVSATPWVGTFILNHRQLFGDGEVENNQFLAVRF